MAFIRISRFVLISGLVFDRLRCSALERVLMLNIQIVISGDRYSGIITYLFDVSEEVDVSLASQGWLLVRRVDAWGRCALLVGNRGANGFRN